MQAGRSGRDKGFRQGKEASLMIAFSQIYLIKVNRMFMQLSVKNDIICNMDKYS